MKFNDRHMTNAMGFFLANIWLLQWLSPDNAQDNQSITTPLFQLSVQATTSVMSLNSSACLALPVRTFSNVSKIDLIEQRSVLFHAG